MLEAKAKDLALLRLRPDFLRSAPDMATRFGLTPSDAQTFETEERAVLEEVDAGSGA